MSDKERIQQMTDGKTEETIIRALNAAEDVGNEVADGAKYFFAGVMSVYRSLSIRPEEFSHGCKTSA